jgi:hypothetical protein
MTMKIEVTIPEDDIRGHTAAEYLARAMSAIGFSREVKIDWPEAHKAADAQNEVLADAGPNYAAMKEPNDAEAAPTAPVRYHGQPSHGGKRRTKAEITLDEEAADLLEDVGLTVEQFNRALDKAAGDWDAVMADLRAAAAAKAPEEKPAISTGEERVDPAQEEEEDEDEPEQEEAEALTHDDVRNALGDYAAKFGMPAAQKNGPKLMGADKISAIPEDQVALRKAVRAIRDAIAAG